MAERIAPHRSFARQRWSLADIPWHEIRHDRVANSDAFFYLVASASLMESATDLYTENLIEFLAGDDEVTSWLEHYWLPEELQHGRALRRYVETAWPEFEWEPAYLRFVEEFRPFCDTSLETRRSLEMASRCVVEMGTASYYTTLSRASPEPVLSLLARRIVEDEVRHYKHFYRFFRRYREAECPSRAAIASGAVAAVADDRRRRQLYCSEKCLSSVVIPRPPSMPRCIATCAGNAAISFAITFRTR